VTGSARRATVSGSSSTASTRSGSCSAPRPSGSAASRSAAPPATLFDRGLECGIEANAGKYLAAEAGFEACHTAMLTLGGMGYAQEYHVERYLREILIPRTAPVSPHMILNFLAEKVLGLPKSY
jgi:acyl-CoA dehydrogenase